MITWEGLSNDDINMYHNSLVTKRSTHYDEIEKLTIKIKEANTELSRRAEKQD